MAYMWFKQLYKVYKLAQLQAGSFEATNKHVTCYIRIFSCLLSCCFALAWIMEKSHFQRPLTLIIKLGVITSLHSPRIVRGRVSSLSSAGVSRSRFNYATARDPNICTTVLLPHVKTD